MSIYPVSLSVVRFKFRLVVFCVQVDWDSEEECFETFARQTSEFYAVKKDWLREDEQNNTSQQVIKQYKSTGNKTIQVNR